MRPASRPLDLPLIGVAVAASALLMHVAIGAQWQPAASLDLMALAGVAVAGIGSIRAVAASRREVAQASEAVSVQRRIAAASAEVIDGAGEAIIVIDDQATIATFNRAAERMFGYSAEELIGTSLERLMTDGGRKAHAAYMAKAGVTAMVEAARLRTIHKGVRKRGDVFTFELHMTEWSDAGRRMFTGVIHDVTGREQASDALRAAEGRFTALFETSRDPLLVFALSGGGGFALEQMNAAAEAYMGLSRYAVVGWGPEQLVLGDELRGLRRGLLDCLSSGSAGDHEARLTSKDGLRTARLTFSPMGENRAEMRRFLVCAQPEASPQNAGTRAA